jgi:Trk-type K+ transport system membrane component
VELLPLDSKWRVLLPRSGVGLSLSAGFPALAKAIAVLIMLYGRTRSLPQVLVLSQYF